MTSTKPPSEQKAKINADGAERFVEQYRSNVKSDVIEITEDKLENILLKHLTKLMTRKGWMMPLSLFISVFLASLTATFTRKFGIEGHVWQATFILSVIVSGVWLVASIVKLAMCWKESSMDTLINTIKNVVAHK